ncbi:MAG TPA: alpha/beta hydrolase [Ramlibacter sp.]|nr:alpha/beta hydrolase [Ramlibacter sp.]
MTVPATPHFVTVASGQLRLWSAGEGAPVVVLPGLVRAASVVANQLAAVAPDRAFRVFELPGIGGSADVPCESLAQIVDAVRGAIESAGLGGAPILAFDLAAPIAAQLRGTREFVNLAPARAWAWRGLATPDLTPRPDGTHLNALFAHLRDAQTLDAQTGRCAAREGDPLPTPDELDAMMVTAGIRPQAYAALWSICCAATRTLDAEGAATLDAALAVMRGAARCPAGALPRPTPTDSIWRDYVDTPRGRIHLRLSGPERRPVIALHSAPGSAAPLRPLLADLGTARRVIAPDFLGNGDSAKPDARVDIATLARDAVAVADAIGLPTFDLWGTHTGALIALEVAIQAPDRVGRVILEAPPLLEPAFTADLLANYFPELRPDGWGLYLQQAWNMRRDMFLFWPWYRAERTAARPLAIPDAAFLHDWTIGLLTSGATYHRTYRAAFEYDTRARLPLLRRPALLCAGPADMLADGLAAAGDLIAGEAMVAPTPATVWYPGQGEAAVRQTMAAYERFLETGGVG